MGKQGVTGDRTKTPRSDSFKARHGKNIAKGKMSAAYWANKGEMVTCGAPISSIMLSNNKLNGLCLLYGGPVFEAERRVLYGDGPELVYLT